MKAHVLRIIASCVFAIPFLATAQITISQADVNRIIGAGNTVVNRTDNTTTFNIGSPGSNFWNFSGLQTNSFQAYTSVVASGSPWIANFPGATNCFKVDTSLQGINGTVYQYLQLTSGGLRNLGNMARQTVFLSTIELRTTVTPAETVYAVPISMGTTWHSAFSNNTRITLGGQELSNTTTTHNATYRVDGFGTMRLPGSTLSQYALRIRKINFYNGSPVLSYLFLSRGGAQVLCEAIDTSAISGLIPVRAGTVVWNTSIVSDSTTGVRLDESLPQEFALLSNYPNPFNPSTTIAYRVASPALVSLKIFNMLGQEVATLVNDVKSSGTYEVNWNAEGFSSGLYVYRMQSGSFIASRGMLLLK